MTDRVIVYDGALPQSTDVLNSNKFQMVGLAFACRAAFGTNTVVNGLACTQSVVANMQVNVAPGSIYAVDQVDATAYGDLGIDNAFIVKQGINYVNQILTLTAPTIAGYSQVYLIQAQLTDIDAGGTVMPYFNAANPSQPFSGPSNSGASQLTLRTVVCTLSLVAGVAAPTGSQSTPPPSSGAVGLYAITLINGQTSITNAQIIQQASAPFFPNLPQVPAGVQTNQWVYAADTGTVNTIVASVVPPPAALVPALVAVIKLANTVTGPATLNLNGLGAVPVHRATGSPLSSGDITAGQVVTFLYDGASFQIMNFSGATTGSTTNNYNSYAIPYGADAGSVNALSVATFTPVVSALSAGLIVLVKASTTNTGACTLNASGTGAVNILENQIALLPGAIVTGQMLLLCYDGTFWQKLNSRNMYYAFDVATPPASDVPLQIGDQLNITFTNATAVPFKIAVVPGIYEVEMVVTVNSSLFTSCCHRCNNAKFTGLFNNFIASNTDQGVTAPPYITGSPAAHLGDGFLDEFGFNLFEGPLTRQDTINAIGPILIRMTFCTVTVAKMCRWHGGCFGGPSHGHSFWNDSVTSWTSLGTFAVYKDVHHFGNTLATISGLAYVRRLGLMSNIQLLPQFDGDNCSFATCANSWWIDIIYFTQPGFGAPVQVPGCSIVSGQNVLTVPDTTMLFPGMTISSLAVGIPIGAFIGVVSPASITMVTNAGAVLNASASNVDVTLNFNPPPLDLTGISFICNWRRRKREWGASRFGWNGEQIFLTCQTADTTMIAGGPLGTLQFNVPDFLLGRVPPGLYLMDIVAIDAIYRVNLFQNGPCQIFHTGGVSDPSLLLTTAQVGSGPGD